MSFHHTRWLFAGLEARARRELLDAILEHYDVLRDGVAEEYLADLTQFPESEWPADPKFRERMRNWKKQKTEATQKLHAVLRSQGGFTLRELLDRGATMVRRKGWIPDVYMLYMPVLPTVIQLNSRSKGQIASTTLDEVLKGWGQVPDWEETRF